MSRRKFASLSFTSHATFVSRATHSLAPRFAKPNFFPVLQAGPMQILIAVFCNLFCLLQGIELSKNWVTKKWALIVRLFQSFGDKNTNLFPTFLEILLFISTINQSIPFITSVKNPFQKRPFFYMTQGPFKRPPL